MRQSTNMAVERVRGMADIPPETHALRQAVANRILAVCDAAGYVLMDFPVVEATELFLRKAGEERVQQMYAFRYRNRDLCLRPEFTASVVRSVTATMQSAPLPARVAYHGPVFRYERPGQARYRQFTEVGVELLGAATAAADAEVIGTAVGALRAAGIPTVRLVVGHVGVVRSFLAGLSLDERVRDWLVWSMERLRPDDPRGERIHPALASMLADERSQTLTVAPTPPDRDVFLSLLREAGISLEGNRRSPEEIAEGLIRKVARRAEGNDVRRALDFLRRLVTLRGAPAEVLPALTKLLTENGLATSAVERLHAIIALMAAYGVAPEDIVLDLGLGRGLHYYTGVLFEVYGDGPDQLGGGGRYDDLASILGARQPLPAVGFSLGVERIADALGVRGNPQRPDAPTVALAGGGNANDFVAAAIAQTLRASGWRVLVDVRDRTANAALKHARSIRADVFAEVQAGGETLRWLPLNGEEGRVLPVDGLPQSGRATIRDMRDGGQNGVKERGS